MEMTNSLRKTITSLASAKGRRDNGLFVVEGGKAISEVISCFKVHSVWVTPEWIKANPDFFHHGIEVQVIPNKEFVRLSFLKNPQGVLAVFRIPDVSPVDDRIFRDNLVIALDAVQDPGNMGTIIRIADWFGIRDILASENCVDVFSPKVVQATMGAIGRVTVHYLDLAEKLGSVPEDVPVYGTFLDGDNVYQADIKADNGVIVMGNEGNGISAEVARKVTKKLLIPSYPATGQEAVVESLNVGVATAITIAEFRRRSMQKY